MIESGKQNQSMNQEFLDLNKLQLIVSSLIFVFRVSFQISMNENLKFFYYSRVTTRDLARSSRAYNRAEPGLIWSSQVRFRAKTAKLFRVACRAKSGKNSRVIEPSQSPGYNRWERFFALFCWNKIRGSEPAVSFGGSDSGKKGRPWRFRLQLCLRSNKNATNFKVIFSKSQDRKYFISIYFL